MKIILSLHLDSEKILLTLDILRWQQVFFSYDKQLHNCFDTDLCLFYGSDSDIYNFIVTNNSDR